MNRKALKKKIIEARIFPSPEVMAIVGLELEKLADAKMIKLAVSKLDAMNPAQIAALLKTAQKDEAEPVEGGSLLPPRIHPQ